MTSYIKAQMFNQLKAKSKCCNAEIIAIMGIPLLRLVCSECRLVLNISRTLSTELHHLLITEENYNRLTKIPKEITNLDDSIDFLIKFYYKHAHLSKAQQILSSEED